MALTSSGSMAPHTHLNLKRVSNAVLYFDVLHVFCAALLDSEFATQRGVHTVSGTYEGARAVAGSGSNFGGCT